MRRRTATMLKAAVAAGTGLPAFNVMHLESATAIAAAADETGIGVVLQISENCVRYHGALAPLAHACFRVAEAASIPIAVHLDHAEDPDLAKEAIDLGFDSVMIDGARLPIEENVAMTAAIAELGRANDVLVEAELGVVGGKGAHDDGARTDPDEARWFQERTDVGALAVAVGSSHAMLERTAALDLDLLARIHQVLPVPIVLHGSSGVPDDGIRAAIAAGATKINVSTQLVQAFTAGVRSSLEDPGLTDSRRYLGAGRDEMRVAAAHLLRVIGTNA